MRQHMMGAVFLLCLGTAVQAADATAPRYIEFRDGTILRLPVLDEDLKVAVLESNGHFATQTVRLSSLKRLTFTPVRVIEHKRKILTAVERLGADDFSEREHAQAELLKMGPAIRSDLEFAQRWFPDVEIRYRLKRILGKWAPKGEAPAAASLGFDVITSKNTLWGDLGTMGIAVCVDGVTRRFFRQQIQTVSIDSPGPFSFVAPVSQPAGFRRIQEKDFPHGCMEEPFETAPDGRKLTAGENIERLFISKGFVLSTSIRDSYVSVNHFTVHGKSRGLSVATQQPLYHGEITIRFVQPGHENVPAGVHYFGLWIAIVMRDGTALVAYDFQGREIGTIRTQHGPHEFMGIYSSVPMHKIRVVPNLKIDPDYTFDDLIYSPPEPADDAHPEKFTVDFASGERMRCNDVTLTGKEVHLLGLSYGLADRSRRLADMIRVTTPSRKRHGSPFAAGMFAKLTDGSVIFGATPANGDGPPSFARRPDTLREPQSLVALWKTDFPRLGWPAMVVQPFVWDAPKKSWQKVQDVAFRDHALLWTPAGGKRQTHRYADVSAILLHESSPIMKPGSWHVITTRGEDMVLERAKANKLSGRLSQELHAVWQGKPINIRGAELVSVFQVMKGP